MTKAPTTPQQKIETARKLLGEAHGELTRALSQEKTRKRAALTQALWTVQKMAGTMPQYFSQAGQDRFVDHAILDAKHGGVFVDIGGYDGITGSNTLFFEMFRDWGGVLVEPAPDMLSVARGMRRCECLGCGVAGQPGTARFMHVTEGYRQMSGFLDSYDPALLEKVRANPAHRETVITVETRTLDDILKSEGVEKVDYLSLDVEGGELDILTGFPFAEFDITCWSIENNTATPEIPRLMAANGYDLVEFAGVDEIYRKKK